MEVVSFSIGVIGNVISLLVFLSPVGTFWRIIKRGSTEEFESLPYICTLLNSALWTYYGIIKPGALLVATINGFGVLVETIFVTLFLIYAPAKSRAKTAILFGILDVSFLAAAVLVAQLALQRETRIDAIGFLCAGLNIIMYGSPLAAMRTVVTTKSVEYMPFFLSFFLFLNGGTWTIYALLVRDYFLLERSIQRLSSLILDLYKNINKKRLVPNGSGFLLGTAQLVLYAIYRKPRRSENDSERLQEEWQHECLVSSSSHDQSH